MRLIQLLDADSCEPVALYNCEKTVEELSDDEVKALFKKREEILDSIDNGQYVGSESQSDPYADAEAIINDNGIYRVFVEQEVYVRTY